jgi:trehalose 6-phosphate synthase/phosphatase
VRDFKRARRPLLLLDYDGTLVPLVGRPDDARPDARLMGLLRRLAGSHGARVFLTSGRPRGPLEAWFGDLPVGLVAEHGAWYRYPASIEGTVLAGRDTAWKAPVRAILDLFVGRIPGSFVEEKEFSLVWHYRQSNPAIGAEAAKELLSALTHLTANMDIGVLPGNAVVEVKSLGTGKGAFFARVLANRHHDFILAAGDDETDETLFRALPADAHTVRVGVRASAARFYVEDVDEMRALLDQLSRARHQRMTSR